MLFELSDWVVGSSNVDTTIRNAGHLIDDCNLQSKGHEE